MIEEITLENEVGERFTCQVPKDDYERMVNGDLLLAQKYMNKSIEQKHQKMAFGLLKELNNSPCSSSEKAVTVPSCSNNNTQDYEPDNFKWTHQLTISLVNVRLQRELQFNKPTCTKKKLWSQIAAEVSKVNNCCVTGNMCDIKYRNLVATYKKNKKKSQQTGEGAVTWEYFNIFDEVLGNKASTVPSEEVLGDCNSIAETAENDLENDCSEVNVTPRRVTLKKRKDNTSLEFFKYKFECEKRRKSERDAKKHEEWLEKKALKEREIEAIEHLAAAIAGTYSKRD